ncbi:protein of unknown function [Flavobacteriaceae bacterium MAR_2010_188]|nr:protein of unknown function [Flavobacteriaceae bacterium MAR_2010_188]
MKTLALYINFVLILSAYSCVEEIDIGTDDESASLAANTLVVEATLTDSLQIQKVILSRAVSFDNDTIVGYDDYFSTILNERQFRERPIAYETNARVIVESSDGKIFEFREVETGRYFSVSPFKIENGIGYQLQISTAKGEQIKSDFETLSGISKLEKLYVETGINNDGEEGLFFFVDTPKNINATTTYYRYSYEETLKIVAPNWYPFEFKLTDYNPCALPEPTYNLEIVRREGESKTCYRTEYSEEIVQTSTEKFSANNIEKFPVYFLGKNRYELAHRYSLLLTQFVENIDSYLYYDKLKNFSQSTNVFYQVQPGFLKGNLSDENDNRKLVIGYFSVASIAQRRIFIDYNDYFTGQPDQTYLVECRILTSRESHESYCEPPNPDPDPDICPPSVIELVAADLISYYDEYDEAQVPPLISCPGPYPHMYVPKICGDCTMLGSNVKPDFWID